MSCKRLSTAQKKEDMYHTQLRGASRTDLKVDTHSERMPGMEFWLLERESQRG